MARFWKGFWQLADPKIWVASTVPMLVAFAFTYPGRRENAILFFVLSVLAIYLVEIAKNALNEVVDYLSGDDPSVAAENITPFSGGKKTITGGLLTVAQSAVISVCCYAFCALIGFAIVLLHDRSVLWIGAAGVGLSVLYSLPPIKLCYRGLGEITVGFTFGPLLMAGICVVMTGALNLPAMVCSVSLGLLIANVLWINQYPDYEADKSANKKNGVVRMGKENAWKVFALLFTLSDAVLAAAALFIHPAFLLGLVTIPLSVKAVKNARTQYDNIPRLIESNAAMITIYQLTGLAMIAAAVLFHVFPR